MINSYSAKVRNIKIILFNSDSKKITPINKKTNELLNIHQIIKKILNLVMFLI